MINYWFERSKSEGVLGYRVEIFRRVVDQEGVDYLDRLRSKDFVSILDQLEPMFDLGDEEQRIV